jgi:hypothetical protein
MKRHPITPTVELLPSPLKTGQSNIQPIGNKKFKQGSAKHMLIGQENDDTDSGWSESEEN